MIRIRFAVVALCVGALFAAPAMGQSTAPQKPAATKPAKPSGGIVETARKEWDGVSTMTRRQWNAMKRRWSREKQKWATCNAQARRQKLSTADRWTHVGKCMVK